tara:strand:- start:3317 stop:3913 length:597 start_codon:yes stop_codon:yes gene_type:complete
MFSGIVEEIGVVRDIVATDKSKKITITCDKVLDGVIVGDSISVNGVCLTAITIDNNQFTADIVNETLIKTNLGSLNKDSKVNLERSLQYNQRVGGHLVQGHVDTIGKIVNIHETDEWNEIMIDIDDNFKKYCIYKGSIAIDGVSLTIANIDKNVIKIALIPHTLEHTISSDYTDGDFVNIETDMYGKYIENFSKGMTN